VAIGDFVDLKTPSMLGHARAVAELAEGAEPASCSAASGGDPVANPLVMAVRRAGAAEATPSALGVGLGGLAVELQRLERLVT
jgi:hypothetical protein